MVKMADALRQNFKILEPTFKEVIFHFLLTRDCIKDMWDFFLF